MTVGNFGQNFKIGNVAQWITDRFAENSLGFVVDQLLESSRVTIIGKTYINAVLRQGVGKQIVSTAIQRGRRNDVIACFGNGHDGIGNGCHTGCYRQTGQTAFQLGYPLFQYVSRWIHDAGVDIAGHFQIE